MKPQQDTRMYQPQTPLIETSPRFKTKRLGEIELGQLVLLGDSAEAPGSAGIGIRGDALSRKGEITEGVFRLERQTVTFERHALDASITALEIEYTLQADLAGITVRTLHSGDLLVKLPGSYSGLVVTGPWAGMSGLLDLSSAVARPLVDAIAAARSVALSWRLVDRHDRTRVLFRRAEPERVTERAPQRSFGEDCD